tara:strand:- start:5211 stop:5612 length:402 start_codon:yes stop_codon:yes gene_type:complete
MRYRSGYKYQIHEECHLLTPVTGHNSEHPYISLWTDGRLAIREGYAWDGPSGFVTVHTDNLMTPSLVHDALYQLMREGLLPESRRLDVDLCLRGMCLKRGMWRIRAAYIYKAVRAFGVSAASKGNTNPVLEAP